MGYFAKQRHKSAKEQEYRNQLVQGPKTQRQETRPHLVSEDDRLRTAIITRQVKTVWPVMILAYVLGLVAIGVNATFLWTQGSTEISRYLFVFVGIVLEGFLFFLPTLPCNVGWKLILWPPLFAFAVINTVGWASINLTDVAASRAERITPAIVDAQRKLDTLARSREAECLKRGPLCRELEVKEQDALGDLQSERRKVGVNADPQITKLSELSKWVSAGSINLSADNFTMLKLLFLAVFLNIGGVIKMVSRK